MHDSKTIMISYTNYNFECKDDQRWCLNLMDDDDETGRPQQERAISYGLKINTNDILYLISICITL